MNASQASDSALLTTLNGVLDPELGRTLGELKMLKAATSAGSSVQVDIELPTPAYPNRERLIAAVKSALPQAKDVRVNFSAVVKGKNAGGKIGLNVHNIIAVGSGKGGV